LAKKLDTTKNRSAYLPSTQYESELIYLGIFGLLYKLTLGTGSCDRKTIGEKFQATISLIAFLSPESRFIYSV
jgi:hypothetical protein